ncbi:MAG TPA: hypothetical protein VH107_00300 [Lacipirellulaceae bacterium]|nr:hypothetical protein [Lacipirellulaceae bacterium]
MPTYHPVVVACKISQLVNEVSPDVNRLLERIYEAVVLYEINDNPLEPSAWRPRQHDFEQIAIASRLRDAQAAKREILNSVRESCDPAVNLWQRILNEREPELPAAIAEARALVAEPKFFLRQRDARLTTQRLCRAINGATIDQLYRLIQKSTDPVQAMLLLTLAEEFDAHFGETVLRSKLDRVTKLENPESFQHGVTSDERDRLISRLLKIVKAVCDTSSR